MPIELPNLIQRCLRLSAVVGFVICVQTTPGSAESAMGLNNKKLGDLQFNERPITFAKRARISYDTYILGPGDAIYIELLDLPDFTGIFSIEPDGAIYLPRLRSLYVEGLTLEELREFLTQQFSAYIRNPQIYLRPAVYRPIRIYIDGEISRPGYYTLSGRQLFDNKSIKNTKRIGNASIQDNLAQIQLDRPGLGNEFPNIVDSASANPGFTPYVFPTVFDAIKTAQGITPYSDLKQVKVIRKRAEGLGGGRISTNLNFLSLITEGNESQNIRLFDGDVLHIGRSDVILKDQLLRAGKTNLSPQHIEVFVSGRVNSPGGVTLPHGSSLNQAISVAGGTKFLKGKVEFIRFNKDGKVDRRVFSQKSSAPPGTYRNPILQASDLIRIKDSFISESFEAFNEITSPFVGIYSVYSLFNGIRR